MIKTHRLLVFIAAMVQAFLLGAQDPYYTTISLSDGLPSNTVYDVLQDSKGYIWLATAEGLSRYDGFECITYTGPQQTSKAGGSIKEDKYGRIWYENFDGYLYYLENDTLKNLQAQQKPMGFINFAILGDRIVATHTNAIDYYDLKTLTYISSKTLADGYISNAVVRGNDFYIVSTLLYHVNYNPDNNSYTIREIKTDKTEIGRLCAAPDGVFCYNQLNKINKVLQYKKNSNSLTERFTLPSVNFIHIMCYVDGLYWICTPEGVYGVYENGTYINNGKPFFADKNILGVFKDREGNYWFQTGSDGILLVPDLNTRLWDIGGLNPSYVSIYKNNAFIGTQKGQILKADLANFSFTTLFKNKGGHDISNLSIDTINNLIFSGSSTFKEIDFEGIAQSEAVTAVKDVKRIDDKYHAYAASGVLGLIITSKSNKKSKSIWDSLHTNNINPVDWKNTSMLKTGIRAKSLAYIKNSNRIFFSTNIGLLALTPNGVTEVKYEGKNLFIINLQQYGDKIYALATNGTIYCINKQGILSPFAIKPGNDFLVNRIKICGDILFLFSGKQLYYMDLRLPNNTPTRFYSSINANEINDIDAWAGKVIFAIKRGLVMFDFTEQVSPANVTFSINKFSVNNRFIDTNAKVSLHHSLNNIEINYSILSFRPGLNIPLYYSINKGDWQAVPLNSRTLKLASLAPGDYVINFKQGDVVSPQTIKFTIKKPWWQQWWFWGSVFMVSLLAAFTYYRWKLITQRKENELVVEKIELEKNLRQSMLTSIKSQMNPHFFYNALNTIQSYIFTDDKRSASSYLAKFSKLTRMILEMSEKDTVSLTEEVDALILYLELEKARFNEDDFNFSIVVDSSLDLDIVKIPSMIVQPYVENAIKHGLLHKKGKKKLTVDFYIEGSNLCISVDDNGIGRKKSGELAKIKSDKHKPFATRANLKRIEILNKGNNKIGVEYNDKTDFSGIATGTTVHITIPVNPDNTLYNEPTYQSHNN